MKKVKGRLFEEKREIKGGTGATAKGKGSEIGSGKESGRVSRKGSVEAEVDRKVGKEVRREVEQKWIGKEK